MAILKFINDPADFTSLNAAVSTNSRFFDTTRISNGWALDYADNFATAWDRPVGDELWFHFIYGQNGTNIAWDTTVMRFEDDSSNEMFTLEITDNTNVWQVTSDTSQSFSYPSAVNAQLITDLHFVKNGTTDITVTVYVNGTFQGELTVANTNDWDIPVSLTSNPLDNGAQSLFYFGEALVADEDTRGWRLYQLKPTAFGIDQEWDGEASSVVDGSLLTGISTDVLNERASFGVTNIENIPDTALIDRLAIQTYGQRGASGLTSFNHYFRYASATRIDDSDIAMTENTDLYLDEYTTNPDTTNPWVTADLQGIQIGVRARS